MKPNFAHDFSRVQVHTVAPKQIQTKLTINQPGDKYEQEADRVAEQVMHMPEPRLQRQNLPEEKEILQTKPLMQGRVGSGMKGHSEVPDIVNQVLHTSGQPLDLATRDFMESRFGHNFRQVRVHTDGHAAESARAVNARAYTVGQDVVFGAGEYRPETTFGRRLLAHELTHVTQQQAGTPFARTAIQRKEKAPEKNSAAGGPQLDFRPAKNTPPCACLVFIHHDEKNARLMAQLMYEFCRYNLAIVTPQTKIRAIDLPNKGKVDPNELFPRKIAEECWSNDKPCEDFLAKNAKSTKASMVKEFAQRQFFLTIKKCSDGFSLPVVALHNNTIDDTAGYRKAVGDSKAPLNLDPVKGKTFDDTLKAGETSTESNTAPFEDLKEWLLKKMPGVKKKKAAKGAKRTIKGGPITPGKTNIFLWCTAEDISRCHIGDPKRPDNVVWVTNSADFEKLRRTKTNVVLQTRVDPKGKSAEDLSSLFVFLEDIIGANFSALIIQLEADVAVEASAISDAIDDIRKLQEFGDLTLGAALDQLFEILGRIVELLLRLLLVASAQGARALKLSQLRYINIETPNKTYDPSSTTRAELRVESFHDVRATLATVGLDCCDAKPAEGETESAVEKVEKALKEGKLPKKAKKKTKGAIL
jgi:hypothetical protein